VTTHAGERQHKEELKKLVINELKQVRQTAPVDERVAVDYLADANKDPTYLDDFDGPTKVPGGLFGQTKYLYTWSVDFQDLPKNALGTHVLIPEFDMYSCKMTRVRFYPGSATDTQP